MTTKRPEPDPILPILDRLARILEDQDPESSMGIVKVRKSDLAAVLAKAREAL